MYSKMDLILKNNKHGINYRTNHNENNENYGS